MKSSSVVHALSTLSLDKCHLHALHAMHDSSFETARAKCSASALMRIRFDTLA